MRVVAGELRGRRIEGPPEPRRTGIGGGPHTTRPTTRPTTDKVREAVFNALGSLGVVSNAIVVDLFAGSGALGIEALSRGAGRCTFVENDKAALAVLRRNLESLGLTERSAVAATDLERDVSRDGAVRLRGHLANADLVVADPPYGFSLWTDVFGVIADERPDAFVVAETEAGAVIHRQPPAGWKCLRVRDYGRTSVGFFVCIDSTCTVEDA